MTRAGPVMGHPGRAGNRARRPAFPSAPPAVAALLGLAAEEPPLPFHALPGVEAGHPEEGLAELAAGVTGLAVDALAFLAREAACEHLSEGIWQRITALEEAPALRAPLPDPAGDRADHLHDFRAEDRAFGDAAGSTGRGGRA